MVGPVMLPMVHPKSVPQPCTAIFLVMGGPPKPFMAAVDDPPGPSMHRK